MNTRVTNRAIASAFRMLSEEQGRWPAEQAVTGPFIAALMGDCKVL